MTPSPDGGDQRTPVTGSDGVPIDPPMRTDADALPCSWPQATIDPALDRMFCDDVMMPLRRSSTTTR